MIEFSVSAFKCSHPHIYLFKITYKHVIPFPDGISHPHPNLPGMQPSIAQDVGAPRGHRGCGHGQQVPPQPAAVGTNEAMVEVPGGYPT